MANTPTVYQDAASVLTPAGFKTSHRWYHGTSKALLQSIQQQGLKRSGDRALKDAVKKTMKTIGNEYSESVEPVFLTPSAELAYYWAQQRVNERQMRFGEEESAVVLAVELPDELNAQVKPDVGAASLLLLEEGEAYMAHLALIYQTHNCGIPEIDLMKAKRMEYLTTMGMAYIDQDLDAGLIQLLAE